MRENIAAMRRGSPWGASGGAAPSLMRLSIDRGGPSANPGSARRRADPLAVGRLRRTAEPGLQAARVVRDDGVDPSLGKARPVRRLVGGPGVEGEAPDLRRRYLVGVDEGMRD